MCGGAACCVDQSKAVRGRIRKTDRCWHYLERAAGGVELAVDPVIDEQVAPVDVHYSARRIAAEVSVIGLTAMHAVT
jgi:hypothetical protein